MRRFLEVFLVFVTIAVLAGAVMKFYSTAQKEVPPVPLSTEAAESEMPKGSEDTSAPVKQEIQEFLAECDAIGEVYAPIYRQAVAESAAFGRLDQPFLDQIEDALLDAGYSVLDSDSVYPTYLRQADDVFIFWDKVCNGVNGVVSYWGVSSSGGLYYTELSDWDGVSTVLHAGAEWNETETFSLSYFEKQDIYYWSMTQDRNLLYQDRVADRHWDACHLLRLHPVDPVLYTQYLDYIQPIGYHQVNLFLTDWDASDFGGLCFNDLLGSLHRLQTGTLLYAGDFPYQESPYAHTRIPADLFEQTVLPYFTIDRAALRTKALYDPETDSYPWLDVNSSNVEYYPAVIPEVVEQIPIDDETFCLVVRVMCPDYHTDEVLRHTVTIQRHADGSFQYLGNKVLSRQNVPQPPSVPRLAPQRP